MKTVNVSELRQNLPVYLAKVRKGDEVAVTVHGKVVARLIASEDRQEAARRYFRGLRARGSRVGNVLSSSGDAWDAER
jgi:prevent-host-death family protein